MAGRVPEPRMWLSPWPHDPWVPPSLAAGGHASRPVQSGLVTHSDLRAQDWAAHPPRGALPHALAPSGCVGLRVRATPGEMTLTPHRQVLRPPGAALGKGCVGRRLRPPLPAWLGLCLPASVPGQPSCVSLSPQAPAAPSRAAIWRGRGADTHLRGAGDRC